MDRTEPPQIRGPRQRRGEQPSASADSEQTGAPGHPLATQSKSLASNLVILPSTNPDLIAARLLPSVELPAEFKDQVLPVLHSGVANAFKSGKHGPAELIDASNAMGLLRSHGISLDEAVQYVISEYIKAGIEFARPIVGVFELRNKNEEVGGFESVASSVPELRSVLMDTNQAINCVRTFAAEARAEVLGNFIHEVVHAGGFLKYQVDGDSLGLRQRGLCTLDWRGELTGGQMLEEVLASGLEARYHRSLDISTAVHNRVTLLDVQSETARSFMSKVTALRNEIADRLPAAERQLLQPELTDAQRAEEALVIQPFIATRLHAAPEQPVAISGYSYAGTCLEFLARELFPDRLPEVAKLGLENLLLRAQYTGDSDYLSQRFVERFGEAGSRMLWAYDTRVFDFGLLAMYALAGQAVAAGELGSMRAKILDLMSEGTTLL